MIAVFYCEVLYGVFILLKQQLLDIAAAQRA